MKESIFGLPQHVLILSICLFTGVSTIFRRLKISNNKNKLILIINMITGIDKIASYFYYTAIV